MLFIDEETDSPRRLVWSLTVALEKVAEMGGLRALAV